MSTELDHVNFNSTDDVNLLPASYFFDIYSLSMKKLDYGKKVWEAYVLDVVNLATNSIFVKLKQIIDEVKNETLILMKQDGGHLLRSTKRNWFDDVIKQFIEYLTELAEATKKDNKTLILGFSSCWWYELLHELFKIIEKLKVKYSHIIFVLWWSDVNDVKDKKFIDMVFEWWIDIINVWWAEQFVNFIGNIWKEDKFFRDKKWDLFLETNREVPNNILFGTSTRDLSEIIPWWKIETTYRHNLDENIFSFSIDNSSCLNSCNYCANYLHSDRIALRDEDICTAIFQFNEYISLILNNKEIRVSIDNPNPTQYINKFYDFIRWINLTNVKEIWFFSDFIWIWNINKYEKLIEIIEYLKVRYPKIIVSINLSFDALHYEWDWNFIWRTHGNNLATEKELNLWYNWAVAFMNKYHNDNRINIVCSTIMHPNLNVDLFLDRLEFIDSIKKHTKSIYPLVPHINTGLNKDHNWNFIPEYEAVKYIKDKNIYYKFPGQVSHWWYFYLNSFLLDTYIFTKNMWLLDSFQSFLKDNRNDIEEMKTTLFIKFLYASITDINKHIFSLLPDLIQWRRWFADIKKEYLAMKDCVNYAVYYIDFITYRENYIMENNPDYNNSELEWFLKKLEEVKKVYIYLREISFMEDGLFKTIIEYIKG